MNIKIMVMTVLSLTSSLAFAWGDIGHGTVGEIAEQKLTDKGKAFVHSILGNEPLGVAATWPDHVRSDARFSGFAPYHFIEFAAGKKFSEIDKAQLGEKNSDVFISNAQYSLGKSSNFNRDQKAIFLRYLIHVVGDVHQPLHVGNGTDRGANLCSVKIKKAGASEAETVNLHSLWDDVLIGFIADDYRKSMNSGHKVTYFGYSELSKIVLNEVESTKNLKLAPDQNPTESNPAVWYDEARALHSQVYPDTQPTAPEARAYCAHVDAKGVFLPPKSNVIPEIEAPYIQNALPRIKIQLYLAGSRLAQLLNSLAEKTDIKGVSNFAADLAKVQMTTSQMMQLRSPQSKAEKKAKKMK